MYYEIEERMPTTVIWRFRVEADSLEEAQELWQNGEAEQVGSAEIGDSINGYDAVVHIKEEGSF
tara:strand:+ start:202 stop:393 length:192 start_codon:yes stop_codon:yes gene_type:complete